MKMKFNFVIFLFVILSIMASCTANLGKKGRNELIEGKKYTRQSNFEKALKKFSQAIEKDPAYWKAYFYRGIIYQEFSKIDLAISDLSKALELIPKIEKWYSKLPHDKWAEIYVMRGRLYHRETKYDSAIADFDKAIELDSNSKGAYYYRAISKEAVGDYQDALKDYTRAINSASEFMSGISDTAIAQAYVDRADLYRKLNKLELALADNNKALSIEETWVAFLSRGTTFAKMERFNEAITDFSRTLELNPLSETAYLYRASSRMLSDCDLTDILADYYALVAVETIDNETLHQGYNQIAWILATAEDDGIRDGKKALDYARKALELEHNLFNIDTLAVAWAESGEYERAVDTVKQAIELSKKDHPELLPDLETHLKSFLQKKPIREKCPGAKTELEQLRKWQGR